MSETKNNDHDEALRHERIEAIRLMLYSESQHRQLCNFLQLNPDQASLYPGLFDRLLESPALEEIQHLLPLVLCKFNSDLRQLVAQWINTGSDIQVAILFRSLARTPHRRWVLNCLKNYSSTNANMSHEVLHEHVACVLAHHISDSWIRDLIIQCGRFNCVFCNENESLLNSRCDK